MSRLVFVQMSGVPGAGKTTVANALAKEIGAVVIDHDTTKSALLEADIPVADAGRASYIVLHALARHLLQQGQRVIFDSPCFYEDLLKRGQQLAAEFGANYRYVECRIDDLHELDRRLQTRVRKPSQLAGVFAQPTVGSGKETTGEAYFRHAIENMKRPATDYLVVDTSQPLDSYIEKVLAYVMKSATKLP